MPWLVLSLGLLLGGWGGAAIVHGYPYMQLEFGWTEVIAGSTAVAGGTVTVALAAVLGSLGRLRRTIERGRQMSSVALHPAPSPGPSPDLRAASPLAVSASSEREAVVHPARPAESQRTDGRRDRAASKSSAPARVEPPPMDEDTRIPSIAGRYEAGGSSYLLYSDGTIEVDGEAGQHRFKSMEELKVFLDKTQPATVDADSAR